MIWATPTLVMGGIIATAIPIAIHFFFRRRQKPIEWAAMDLLRRAIHQTTRRRHIEKVTLLLVRCLAIIAAGMAIAGPLLTRKPNEATAIGRVARDIVLVVDDGVSEHVSSGSSTAFESSRKLALSAIDDLQGGDRVGIILAAGARQLVWPPSEDIAASRAVLQGVSAGYTPSDIGGAISIVEGMTNSLGVLSSFRRGSTTNLHTTTTKQTVDLWITTPNQTDISNIQITAFDPQARGPLSSPGAIPFRVALKREGEQLGAEESQIDVTTEGGSRTTLRAIWSEGQAEATIHGSLAIPTQHQSDVAVRAQLVRKDSQPADDERFAVLSTSNTMRVGIIDRPSTPTNANSVDDGAGAWVERALRPTDDVDIETEIIDPTAITQQRCKGLVAVVVVRADAIDEAGWAVLAGGVQSGLVVVLVPPSQPTNTKWFRSFASAFKLDWKLSGDPVRFDPPTTLRHTDSVHPLLLQISSEIQDLKQPITISAHQRFDIPNGGSEAILALQDGSPFLIRAVNTKSLGSVLVFSAPPEIGWTNLPAKPLMVPLFQELIRQSVAQFDQGRVMSVGSDHLPIMTPGSVGIRLVLARSDRAVSSQRLIAVDGSGKLATTVDQPGVYTTVDSTNRMTGRVVANVDPTAASTRASSLGEVSSALVGFAVKVSDGDLSQEIGGGSVQQDGAPSRSKDLPIAAALNGYSLAIWFFGGLMLLLLVETWLARRASAGAVIARPNRGDW